MGKATLREIEEHYSLCDLQDLHDTIEAIAEVENLMAKRKGGK